MQFCFEYSLEVGDFFPQHPPPRNFPICVHPLQSGGDILSLITDLHGPSA